MTLDADIRVELDGFALAAELHVERGETVAVVGANGAGKTTLLRALSGLRPLGAGRIELDGRVLDEPASGTYLAPERRPIGVVFQDNLLFPHLNALDNVAFGLRARGMRKDEAARMAAGWLDRVGLAGRGEAWPSELSGGQAQRVALARALAIDPELLLLDEPLAALDVTTRAEVRRDLGAHLAGFAGIRVLVTHDPLDAAVLADRMVVLENGAVAQTGTPAEITAQPRTRWVAELVGTNLFAGVNDAHRVRLHDGGHLAVAGDMPGGEVLVTVHPRAVALHLKRPEGSARNVWPGHVASLEASGGRVRVRVEGIPSIIAELTPGSTSALGLLEDSEVWVSVKATEIDVFPA